MWLTKFRQAFANLLLPNLLFFQAAVSARIIGKIDPDDVQVHIWVHPPLTHLAKGQQKSAFLFLGYE